MKKFVFLLSIVCLFAMSAFAQTPSFAGDWKLDTSKLDERRAAMIESQTMKVEQTDKEIKSTTTIVQKAGAQTNGRGMGPGGTNTYKLDGSEVVTERDTPNGKVSIKTTTKLNGNKLEISNTFPGPNGDVTNKTTWELSADGKTLTVKSTRMTPNGEVTIESVYNKS
jgi:hypothetical protein